MGAYLIVTPGRAFSTFHWNSGRCLSLPSLYDTDRGIDEGMYMSRPRLFIGSSKEALPYARALEQGLTDYAEITVWKDGVFGLSQTAIESLILALSGFDFAVLVITPDDLLTSRGRKMPSPRDNVIFELGLFVGGIGRERTIVLLDDSQRTKLPSDLAGVTGVPFNPVRGDKNLISALAPAATTIGQHVQLHGSRLRTDVLDGPSYGVRRISSGRGRNDAFIDLRRRAQRRVVIVGALMAHMAGFGINQLEAQAIQVPLDLYMLDPDYIEANSAVAAAISDFFRRNSLASELRRNFTALEQLTKEWNSRLAPPPKSKRGAAAQNNGPHPMSLRVYSCLPTMSMVMIDPPDNSNELSGEMEVEFFLYQCGIDRPRIGVVNGGDEGNLFRQIHREFGRLHDHSRLVVGPEP